MELVNLGHVFVAFWNVAGSQKISVQKKLWRELYVQPHEEVITYYETLFPSPEPLEVSLRRLAAITNIIGTLANETETILEEAVKVCRVRLNAPNLQTKHVAFVGRFTANAWTEVLNEVPTCFYALEMFSNKRSLLSTVVHETTHVFHRELSDVTSRPLTVAARLVMEGLAVELATPFTPGLTKAQRLWGGQEVTLDGQDVETWLAQCEENHGYIVQHVLSDIDSTKNATKERYFGINPAHLLDGIPMRAGYYVAHCLFEQLSERYRIADLARFSRERARGEIRRGLIQMSS